MKKVMAFGTFDILHPGHLSYLRQAKKWGDFLMVVVARDQNVKKTKGQKPQHNEKKRLSRIKKLKIVDKATLGFLKNPYKIIEKEKPDIIALGYDQKFFTENLKEELKKRNLNCKIIRLKSFKPQKYKSSRLRKKFKRLK